MILSAGLTPAWQQILLFDHFVPGEVNRAREAHWCGSGKVVNVGLALARLGGPTRTLCVLGGAAGDAIAGDLRDLGVPMRRVDSRAPTRVCTTILCGQTGRTTELVENASPLAEAELDAFRDAFREESAAASHIVLTGSLPFGTPSGLYAELMRSGPAGARYILDCRGPELLDALPLRPTVVKPNLEELSRTANRPLSSDADVWRSMRELNERGAEWVVVSQGGGAVRASSVESRVVLTPSKPATVVNPIGCGDCLAAGIAWKLQDGGDPIDAMRFGMAAAADNLAQLLPARLDPERVERVVSSIVATWV